jgi:molybdenum cofactor cytidylyltransferase
MIQGILLAAGSASRFGGGKLLHPLADGAPIGVASLRILQRALPNVIVVVRAGDEKLRAVFEGKNAQVLVSSDAHLGMGHSLVCGVDASREADGWVIALADMPFLQPNTITAVAQRIESGGRIAMPSYRGERGHPVGFGSRYRNELLNLGGDAGARALVARHGDDVEVIDCDDPGVLRDIDTRADLPQISRSDT